MLKFMPQLETATYVTWLLVLLSHFIYAYMTNTNLISKQFLSVYETQKVVQQN